MKKSKKQNCRHGMYVPAGMFIGIGVGMLIGNVAAGTLIGMGLGFLASIIF